MTEMLETLQAGMERLAAALEGHAVKLEAAGEVSKITAAVEGAQESTSREMELQRRLDQALGALTALQAESAPAESKAARKTLPSATVQLLAKQGIDAADSVDVTTLDAALAGMSVEQRIAVKSQLMRTGALTL